MASTSEPVGQQTGPTLPPTTMFGRTPAYRLPDGEVVFGLRLAEVVPAPTDKELVVNQATANRLDLISAVTLQQDMNWWAIADASNLADPLLLEPGTKLRIPSPGRLPS